MGDLWGIMMTGQAFLAQCPIDEILVKIKMKPYIYVKIFLLVCSVLNILVHALQLEIQEIRISKWTQILFEKRETHMV